jgi:KUP system potassium uptake protein
MKEIFQPGHRHTTGCRAHLIGAVSVIFWGLMMVVTLKYVLLILRADNRGEGGIMALDRAGGGSGAGSAPQPAAHSVVDSAFFGAALFYGDSVITPAISVPQRRRRAGMWQRLRIQATMCCRSAPTCVLVLTALFAVQRYGTGAGRQALWSRSSCCGLRVLAGHSVMLEIAQQPAISGGAQPHQRVGSF